MIDIYKNATISVSYKWALVQKNITNLQFKFRPWIVKSKII